MSSVVNEKVKKQSVLSKTQKKWLLNNNVHEKQACFKKKRSPKVFRGPTSLLRGIPPTGINCNYNTVAFVRGDLCPINPVYPQHKGKYFSLSTENKKIQGYPLYLKFCLYLILRIVGAPSFAVTSVFSSNFCMKHNWFLLAFYVVLSVDNFIYLCKFLNCLFPSLWKYKYSFGFYPCVLEEEFKIRNLCESCSICFLILSDIKVLYSNFFRHR